MQRMYSFLCLLRYVFLESEPEDEEAEEEAEEDERWRRLFLPFLREPFLILTLWVTGLFPGFGADTLAGRARAERPATALARNEPDDSDPPDGCAGSSEVSSAEESDRPLCGRVYSTVSTAPSELLSLVPVVLGGGVCLGVRTAAMSRVWTLVSLGFGCASSVSAFCAEGGSSCLAGSLVIGVVGGVGCGSGDASRTTVSLAGSSGFCSTRTAVREALCLGRS